MTRGAGWKSTLTSWLRFFRAPNLFTVPGDPLMGFLLSAAVTTHTVGRLAAAVGASVLFYLFGLALNDLVDRAEDARDRPNRPLPSGQIRVRSAWCAALLTLGSALGLCVWIGADALHIGITLAFAILLYNRVLKHTPVLGAFCMGLCRGLSVLLGVAALPFDVPVLPASLIAVLVVTLYVAVITGLARREADPDYRPGSGVWLPFGVLWLGFIAFLPHLEARLVARAGFLVAYGAALLVALRFGWSIWRARMDASQAMPELPPWIGRLIGALIPLQAAALIGLAPGRESLWIGVALLLSWPLSRKLAQQFYAS